MWCAFHEKRRRKRAQVEMWGVSVCPLPWTGMLGWGHKARRQIHRLGWTHCCTLLNFTLLSICNLCNVNLHQNLATLFEAWQKNACVLRVHNTGEEMSVVFSILATQETLIDQIRALERQIQTQIQIQLEIQMCVGHPKSSSDCPSWRAKTAQGSQRPAVSLRRAICAGTFKIERIPRSSSRQGCWTFALACVRKSLGRFNF